MNYYCTTCRKEVVSVQIPQHQFGTHHWVDACSECHNKLHSVNELPPKVTVASLQMWCNDCEGMVDVKSTIANGTKDTACADCGEYDLLYRTGKDTYTSPESMAKALSKGRIPIKLNGEEVGYFDPEKHKIEQSANGLTMTFNYYKSECPKTTS